MALRDKITVRLDGSVPPKERVLEVVATSPGGTVSMVLAPPFVEIIEATRGGRVKSWKRAHQDHVVSIDFTSGK